MRMRFNSTAAVASDERVVPRTGSIDTRESGHPISGENSDSRTIPDTCREFAQKDSSIYL